MSAAVNRDTALMYAAFNGYAVSTARKHLKQGLFARVDDTKPYEDAGFILGVMRENLPEGSLWTVEGHIRHRTFGLLLAVPDELLDDFVEEKFDAVQEKLSSLSKIASMEVLSISEAHSIFECGGMYINLKGQQVLVG